MAKKLPSIIDSADSLLLLDGSIIALDSQKFITWLENNTSFRFDCGLAGKDGYTARKERTGYWYAYKKMGGKLHKAYIGNGTQVTMARLLAVADKLQNSVNMQPKQRLQTEVKEQLHKHDNELHSEVVQRLSVTINNQANAIETMQQTLNALFARVEALESPTKPESSPVENEGIDGYTIQLEKRVNELEATNRELYGEIERLHTELDIARCGVAVEVIEVSGLNYELEAQLETAQQRIVELESQQSQPQLISAQALDDFLASLKLGKQSPDYKAAKKWVAKFVTWLDACACRVLN